MKSVLLVLIVAVVLGVAGAIAGADTADPGGGVPTVDADVQPSGDADTLDEGNSEKKRISISVSYSVFLPGDGETRDNFGDTWSSVSVQPFRPERPDHWTFDLNATLLQKDGASEALLIPVTAGVQRGFGTDPEQQSYVAVRVGPYYGAVDDNMKGPDDSTIGFNANVSAGIILNQRYFLEARQDWFSGLAGNDFDGLTLAAGVKIFDFGL